MGHVALDGTKVRANASKHQAMSYKRMKEKAEQLQGEVDELLRQAQEAEEAEDRRYGKDQRGDELPQELAFREGRLEKIREALAALEAEARGKRNGPRLRAKSIPACPRTRPSATSLMPSLASCPAPGEGTFYRPTTARRWWTARIR